MLVYVISKNEQPLMPTSRLGKVRRLLKENKAKVVKRCPFTIKLLYETQNTIVQEVTLGQDTGSKYIGTACISNNMILYQSSIILRDDIKSIMDNRKENRKRRRSRNTRYRKPRFLNRKNSIKSNRIPPSIKHKIQAHIDEIEFCKKILPISKIVLEVSQFDPHLMENPNLFNEKIRHWGYQKGFNYGWASRREVILNRDSYTCQICGKTNVRLEVHHIIYRSQKGNNDENNLITLCESCHSNIHNGKIKLSKKPKLSNVKYATHMNYIRKQLLKAYVDAIETFGFITKTNRENLKLQKDHFIDACVIASGGEKFVSNNIIYEKRRVAKGDYQLTKGFHGEQKIPVGKILGFKKYDKVAYLGNEYFIKGRMSNGFAILMDISNNKIDFSYMPRGYKTPKLINCKRISARKSCLCIQQKRFSIL